MANTSRSASAGEAGRADRHRGAGGGTAHPRRVLAATILASSLAFIDSSVVQVALPSLGKGFAADVEGLLWVVNSYLLPLSALLVLGGAAGDRFGRRRSMIIGTALFALASLGCAMAPNLNSLLASRFFQGIGAAILTPNSLAVLGSSYSGSAKGRAVGLWAAAGAAMTAFGPVLGGWLIDLGSWRAIFLINLPLATGAIALAWRHVPRDEIDGTRSLDWAGGLLTTVGLGGLTWALTVASGPDGWSAGPTALAAMSAAALLAFVSLERRRGDHAMVPLALFASRSFVGLALLTLFLYGALGALFVLVPFVLIEVSAYSATSAGAALLPLPIILAAASPLTGGLDGRIGTWRLLAAGTLVVAVGFLLTLRISASARYVSEVMPALVVTAAGLSIAVAPLTAAVLNSVDGRYTGSASGINSAVARTGSLIATSLLGPVMATRGDALLASFRVAMLAGAAACLAACLSASYATRQVGRSRPFQR